MDTFGDRLRTEREDRGLSLQAVAEMLRVDRDRLLALERNDFEALPDEAALMDCLHAYADCLEVDAGLMIEDFVRERDQSLRGLDDGVAAPAAGSAAAAIPIGAKPRPQSFSWLAALAVVAIAMLAAWWVLARDRTAPAPPEATAAVEPPPLGSKAPAAVAPKPEAPAAAAPPAAPAQVVEPRPLPPKTPVAPPAARSAPTTPSPPSPPPSLSVPEHGVGTAVEDRRLVGRADRFAEGTQIWFWTRVQGGTRGDSLDHVWLREGVEKLRVSLAVGGSSWRTYSTTTLGAGDAGSWAVEARDAAGRVLARSEFACVP